MDTKSRKTGPSANASENESCDKQRPFLTFGAPLISNDEIAEVGTVLRSGWLGKGPYVQRFEQSFARYKNAENAVAVASCTAALHLSLLAAGIGPGDEVITTPLTFCATINAIIHTGATPVLVDVNPFTMNIDIKLIKEAITDRSRAIVPVHFAGWPCDIGSILRIAAEHGLTVVEDCAHAIEAQYYGKHCGTFGDFGCFSFYVTKNITTGEGGMVLTRTRGDAEKIRRLSLHGLSTDAWARYGPAVFKHYEVVDVGFKYNMTDIQAALGLKQLAKVEKYWKIRHALWLEYDHRLQDLPLCLPNTLPEGMKHAHHLYTVLVDEQYTGMDRDEFVDQLTRQGIGVGIHYLAVTDQGFYQEKYRWAPEDYPNATRIGRQTVSLPLSARMTEADIERVAQSIARICCSR
ncbi:MAG: DegT/DnrJ/EryC1/StrS family aminotransferase [Acidobacteriota bacterium]|nr:DegT/DnrJ/EryC1/StrS family aminotransferase [Acidobacteriota bacterium]